MPAAAVLLPFGLGIWLAPSAAEGPRAPLRFAWPEHSTARVELTDERHFGTESRTSVLSMQMRVAPDGPNRLELRFLDARLVSVDGLPADKVDPRSIHAAATRVMKRATPTIVVSRSGRYLESRDLDRVARSVLFEAGLPLPPGGVEAMKDLLTDVSAADWSAWVELWIGDRPSPGAWVKQRRVMELEGTPTSVTVTRRSLPAPPTAGRERLELVAEYPSSVVRRYMSGLLLDLAIDAGELGDDSRENLRFLDKATFGPVTETLTVELESGSMRPIEVERIRTFFAIAGEHRVDGRERRLHRFTWEETPPASPAP